MLTEFPPSFIVSSNDILFTDFKYYPLSILKKFCLTLRIVSSLIYRRIIKSFIWRNSERSCNLSYIYSFNSPCENTVLKKSRESQEKIVTTLVVRRPIFGEARITNVSLVLFTVQGLIHIFEASSWISGLVLCMLVLAGLFACPHFVDKTDFQYCFSAGDLKGSALYIFWKEDSAQRKRDLDFRFFVAGRHDLFSMNRKPDSVW